MAGRRKKSDGIIDNVLIERALRGNRQAYKDMTDAEAEEFWRQDAIVASMAEPKIREHSNGAATYNPRNVFIAECLGLKIKSVLTMRMRAVNARGEE